MDYQERIEAKVAILFQVVDQYLSGQIPQEEAKDLLNGEMVNIRPAHFEAVKQELGKRLKEAGNQGESEKLFDLFRNYLSPPYYKLQTGHPIRNYYEENSRVRSVLLRIDEMEDEEAAAEDWSALYGLLADFAVHIKRMEKNYYPLLIPIGLSQQVEKASDLGDKILSRVSDNLRRLNNGELIDFLYHQRSLIQHFVNYLDLEERVLFAKALSSFADQDFVELRRSDDEEGYVFIEQPPDLVLQEIENCNIGVKDIKHQAEPMNDSEADQGLILPALLEAKELGIVYYNLAGDVISVMGNQITKADLQLSEDIRKELLNGSGKPLIYRSHQGKQDIKFTCSFVRGSMGEYKGILKIKEKSSYFTEPVEKVFQPINSDQNIAELFQIYPKFKEDFFELDDELKGLRGPVGMSLLKDSTIDMLAKSLRINTDDLVDSINKLLESY